MKPRPLPTLVFLVLAPAVPAFAESEACGMYPKGSESYTCTCGPGPYPDPPGTLGDVYGSAPYSSNNDICRSAQHAGVIGPEGGEVTAISVPPPEDEPRGSTANGITSLSMGSNHWDQAFTFEGAQAPEPLPDCGPLGEAEELACYCVWDRPRGEVWGSNPYTIDSDVCTAAYHAGAILNSRGGNVRVIRAPGQDSYTASTAAGVRTSEHGPAQASFTFGAFE